MEVSGHLHALVALRSGKEPQVPIMYDKGLGGSIAGLDAVEKRNIS
jgi:hypothetical protein